MIEMTTPEAAEFLVVGAMEELMHVPGYITKAASARVVVARTLRELITLAEQEIEMTTANCGLHDLVSFYRDVLKSLGTVTAQQKED